MPQLSLMRWDFRDRLSASPVRWSTAAIRETTYYVYDAGGQRVRKMTELAAATGEAPIRKGERVYVGAFEVHRQYDVTDVVRHQLETVHIMDGPQRIALVETVTQGDEDGHGSSAPFPGRGSSRVGDARTRRRGENLSYEEYLPYGSTSYQAKDPSIRPRPSATATPAWKGTKRADSTIMELGITCPVSGGGSAATPLG